MGFLKSMAEVRPTLRRHCTAFLTANGCPSIESSRNSKSMLAAITNAVLDKISVSQIVHRTGRVLIGLAE
jgi:hypothetical protein